MSLALHMSTSGWITLVGCSFLAFVIGSNDASNAFGICIGCDVTRFNRAVFLFGLCVLLGILLQGHKVMKTVGEDILQVNTSILGPSLVVSALLIAFANWRKMPLSTHQVVIGSLTGSGAAAGADVHMVSLIKIGVSWLISPLAAFLLALVIYRIMERTLSRFPLFHVERMLQGLLAVSGALIAYNIGANDLATVLGGAVFAGLLNPMQGSFGGVLFILLGTVALSPRVMETVGKGITTLDPYSGFAAQFGAATCVLFFTTMGMPISTTYCVVGGIIGVGLLKGLATVRVGLLGKMLLSWVLAPLAAFIICFCVTKIA